MEEATYLSGALAVNDVLAWAASLDPSPKVNHIDLRSPLRNSYLGGKARSTNLWRELRYRVPSLRFLHILPQPATMDQLSNAMRTNPLGKPKEAHVQVYPTTNLVYTPPNCDPVCLQDLAAGAPPDHSFYPFTLHFAHPRRWEDLGMALFHPTIQPKDHIRTSPTPLSTAPLLCDGSGGPHVPPHSFQLTPPTAPNPFPNAPMG